MHPEPAFVYCRQNRHRFVEELRTLVRFPSIGADPGYRTATRQCAHWPAAHLRTIRLEQVKVIPTPGHPIVYAQWMKLTDAPTLLIYGHYDVQPAEPLQNWTVPPFDAVVKNGYLFGRGASDDKGQFFAHLKAIECYLKTTGQLPVNVRVVLEGEEEIGSTHLGGFLDKYRSHLHTDVAVVSDMRMKSADVPAITYSLRGALNAEICVQTDHDELHSGTFGGMVYNPVQVLCEALACLHDSQNKIRLPGFYAAILPVSDAERKYLREQAPSDAQLLQEAGTEQAWGELDYSLYERTTIRPSVAITGLSGGYTGEGVKAVIPAQASATLNFRLVPNQDPDKVARQLAAFLQNSIPPDIKTSLRVTMKAKPVVVDTRHPAMRAAFDAYRMVFGKTPVWLRAGGTIPVVQLLTDKMRIPVVMMGFASATDQMHAPDENFYLPTFFRGIQTSLHFMQNLARLYSQSSNTFAHAHH